MAGGFLGDLLATLFERRGRLLGASSSQPIDALCRALLSGKGEMSGQKLAQAVLSRYADLDADGKLAFFGMLNEELDLDMAAVEAAVGDYAARRDAAHLSRLLRVAEPARQELLRRLNQAPGATERLVAMRRDLLGLLPEHADLKRTDLDFAHLFASWFNRGFLVLRRIDWDTPARILEKIIEYEAVHAIDDWTDLRRRLEPPDRRCFAFFHPAMPDEPLIFVEVALVKGTPGSVQALLDQAPAPLPSDQATTAVFYSISNCQEGLRGISFGNSLIKKVVDVLGRDLPQLRHFVTLSPIPGLARWLDRRAADGDADAAALLAARDAGDALAEHGDRLRAFAAHYLLEAKRSDGQPLDPVARFHLGNGAEVGEVHANADISANGLKQSCGAMVNYRYDLKTVETNLEAFANRGTVTASRSVRSLAAVIPEPPPSVPKLAAPSAAAAANKEPSLHG